MKAAKQRLDAGAITDQPLGWFAASGDPCPMCGRALKFDPGEPTIRQEACVFCECGVDFPVDWDRQQHEEVP
jgi:hypothetical protein